MISKAEGAPAPEKKPEAKIEDLGMEHWWWVFSTAKGHGAHVEFTERDFDSFHLSLSNALESATPPNATFIGVAIKMKEEQDA